MVWFSPIVVVVVEVVVVVDEVVDDVVDDVVVETVVVVDEVVVVVEVVDDVVVVAVELSSPKTNGEHIRNREKTTKVQPHIDKPHPTGLVCFI